MFPYKTVYQWGYLHEALEVDVVNKVKLLFTPNINQGIHAVFLRRIAQSNPGRTHVVIMDQAGFDLQAGDPRVPENMHLSPLSAYCPELNLAEWLGRMARGFRSFKHFQVMAYLKAAKLKPQLPSVLPT